MPPTIVRDNDIDDDGTNTKGTPRTAAWKDAIYQRIDDLIAALYVGPSAWTPTLIGSGGGSGQVYGTRVGRYIKIWKWVFFYGQIALSTLGTLTTSVQISALPFTSTATAGRAGIAVFPYFTNFTASLLWLSGYIQPATSVIVMQRMTAAATGTSNVVQADLAATSTFIFGGMYEVD